MVGLMDSLHLATQTGSCSLVQVFNIIFGKLNGIADAVKMLNSNGTGTFETVGNTDRVDATIEQFLALFEQSTSKN
jgi:hypothetical protein